MDIEIAKEMLKSFNDGYTFQQCETCFKFNEKDSCCNKEKCEELVAIETVLNELEKKECKYIRQNDDWIVYQCSNCKMDWVFEEDEPKDSEFNYCPKCGAKITEVIELEEE